MVNDIKSIYFLVHISVPRRIGGGLAFLVRPI